jgi:GAF domain-containing protein
MPAAELHNRIDEIAPGAFFAAERARGACAASAASDNSDPDLLAMEEHASIGCSLCARALVNARDLAVDIAAFTAPRAPSPSLREKVLQRTQPSHVLAPPASPATALPALVTDAHILDPSGAVAHMHIGGQGEPARKREIEELEAHAGQEGHEASDKALARVLAQVERLLGFSLFFVSIIHGERVGYRVQRGLPSDVPALHSMRREMTFCTHCVNAEAPLVVQNAGKEPFFRGNPAVRRHRIRAYVGVPLRTSKGIIVGTLCALDYKPRSIPPEIVRVLELFAKRVAAELERGRDPSQLSTLVCDLPGGRIYRSGFFEDLLAIELTRSASEGRSSALITVSGAALSLEGVADEGEVAGEIGADAMGLLLSGATAEQVEARRAALSKAFEGPIDIRSALASGSMKTPADWIAAASQT